ncbi:hypothetical protein ABKP74_10360, partial [Bifidobacterium breve]
EEGAPIPGPPHRPGTTTLRPRRLCVVVRRPKTPLHPRIPEPQRIHTTRTRPLKNCPTRRCQSRGADLGGGDAPRAIVRR